MILLRRALAHLARWLQLEDADAPLPGDVVLGCPHAFTVTDWRWTPGRIAFQRFDGSSDSADGLAACAECRDNPDRLVYVQDATWDGARFVDVVQWKDPGA